MSMFIPSLVSWIILISSHSPIVQTPKLGPPAKVVVVAAAAEAFAQLDLDGAQPFDNKAHFPAVFR